MFKKLTNKVFDGMVDLCNPVTDDPMCAFGVSPDTADDQSTLTASKESAKGIWQKVKRVGTKISGKFN